MSREDFERRLQLGKCPRCKTDLVEYPSEYLFECPNEQCEFAIRTEQFDEMAPVGLRIASARTYPPPPDWPGYTPKQFGAIIKGDVSPEMEREISARFKPSGESLKKWREEKDRRFNQHSRFWLKTHPERRKRKDDKEQIRNVRLARVRVRSLHESNSLLNLAGPLEPMQLIYPKNNFTPLYFELENFLEQLEASVNK